MAVACKLKGGNVIPIRKGIPTDTKEPQTEISNHASICAKCGFGASPTNRWRPVMETSSCPMCGSKIKR